MSKRKRYDYANAIAKYCDGCGEAGDYRRILRKLVREAVMRALGNPDAWRDDDSPTQREIDRRLREQAHIGADRIAKELVP